jgi:para-nitrobenzyl esterase
MYLFTYPLKFKGKEVGAIHGGDFAFILGALDDVKMGEYENMEETQLLSEKMMKCWIAFAKTGNPNHEGIEKWPNYDKITRKTMLLGKEIKSVEDPQGKQRIVWEDIMKI